MSRTWTTPQLVLYGPDTAHGAEYKRGLTSYRWYIRHRRDGRPVEKATGATHADIERAEAALARYLMELRREPTATDKNPLIREVLDAYVEERAGELQSADAEEDACIALRAFMGDRLVSEITPMLCKAYDKHKAKTQASSTRRRALGVLKRALKHAKLEQRIAVVPELWMPPEGVPVERHMTRDEVALALRYFRAVGPKAAHMITFLAITLYYAQRREAVCGLRFEPHKDGGWIDLDRMRIDFRRGDGFTTKKRRTAGPIPVKLMPYLLRARRLSQNGWVVEYRGERVKSIKTSWASMLAATGLDFDPRDLTHTCVSWMLQGGYPIFTVSKHVAKSVYIIEKVYGHIAENTLEPDPKLRLRWSVMETPNFQRVSSAKSKKRVLAK